MSRRTVFASLARCAGLMAPLSFILVILSPRTSSLPPFVAPFRGFSLFTSAISIEILRMRLALTVLIFPL